jgi:Predicted AAA-ATPase/PD-(D/E)XK nuclease superfamily
MEKQILPIGRQYFRGMREDNCVYVDKTQHIYNLCTQGKVYFLSRPRRFGKSLLLSTISEVFKGSHDLFKGLWIEDKWDWTQQHPVIHISFTSVDYEEQGLLMGIKRQLLNLYENFDVEVPEDDSLKGLFTDLITKISNKHGKVVILIDEYDKPILDYLEFHNLEQAKINQKILGDFYGGLKDAEPHIRFLFITGVSKFTKVSLFSKLNNLDDITLDKRYATLTGYTQQELELNFEVYLDEAFKDMGEYDTREAFLAEVRRWYNGYSWDGVNRLYNPFDTLCFLAKQDFMSFWFQTGTPAFLLDKMLTQTIFQVENIETNTNFLDEYSLDNVELTSLMFQTGYLTIKEKKRQGELVLSYPNQEVREAMYSFLISKMGKPVGGGGITVQHLNRAFIVNDLQRVRIILTTLFDNLTYDVYAHQTVPQVEGFYHGLIHILFKYLGIYVQSEVHTTKGRADSIVQTSTHIYFFEFKINSDATTALQQIKNNKYAAPFAADSRVKIAIGINFDLQSRTLNDWIEEILN